MAYEDAQTEIFGLVGYIPTEAQLKIHLDQSRNKLIAGGERAGKSKVESKELLCHYAWDILGQKKKEALYWLLGNDYEACRGEWEHILEDFQKLELIKSVTKNIDPGVLELKDGTTIHTKSARYPEKIATVAPDGILICEAAQVDKDVFLRAWTRLAEKRGWLCMGGTFEQEEYLNWYRELFQQGQSENNLGLRSFSLPTWSNLIIFPGGREDPEILKQEAGMTHDRFMERFGGEPCPKSGRVIPEFDNKIHVRKIPFNRNLPVHISIDPGYRGAAAVTAIQDYGDHLVGIDEIYVKNVLLKDVILMTMKKPWYDAISHSVIDIAAKQHQSGLEPAIEVWAKETKGKVVPVCQRLANLENGIDLLRTHLQPHPITGEPGMYLNPENEGMIAECGGGMSPIEGGGVWMRHKDTGKPLERDNHACMTWVYYILDRFGFTGPMKTLPRLEWGGKKPQRTFART